MVLSIELDEAGLRDQLRTATQADMDVHEGGKEPWIDPEGTWGGPSDLGFADDVLQFVQRRHVFGPQWSFSYHFALDESDDSLPRVVICTVRPAGARVTGGCSTILLVPEPSGDGLAGVDLAVELVRSVRDGLRDALAVLT